jgi:hypothetical protein
MSTEPHPPGGDFRLFLQKIAMQGFYALGLVEIPGAPTTEPNLGMAQAVIDDLMMMREKTQANLDDGERLTLDKFISDLQFHYLEKSKAGSGKESSSPPSAESTPEPSAEASSAD